MLVVQKFGGTSLKDDESRSKAVDKILHMIKKGEDVVVVVSAMGRFPMPYSTDALINLVGEGYDNKKELDLIMSCGEVISACVISSLLNKANVKAEVVTAKNVGIITDSNYGNANVIKTDGSYIKSLLNKKVVPVVTGFQAIDSNGNITTLSRGGSDTTACLVAKAINADLIEIYSDVEGIMTADPKFCDDCKIIRKLSYDQLVSITASGAKVVNEDAAMIAKNAGINMAIKSTFSDDDGTLVMSKSKNDKLKIVTNKINSKLENCMDINVFAEVPNLKEVGERITTNLNSNSIKIYRNIVLDNKLEITICNNELKKSISCIHEIIQSYK